MRSAGRYSGKPLIGVTLPVVVGAVVVVAVVVVAGCGFVVDYLHKHPEYSDIAA